MDSSKVNGTPQTGTQNMTPDFEKLVKAPMVEAVVDVSRYTLWALVRANRIPHYKINRGVRFRISEVVDFMKNRAEIAKK